MQPTATFTRTPPLLKTAFALLAAAAAAGGQEIADVPGSEGPVEIVFEMPCDGQASIILYAADGTVLRPLAQLLELAKGRHRLRWDGLDLWGHVVPAGTRAVAKVVTTPGIRAYYEFAAASANRIPWATAPIGEGDSQRAGGWLGDHSPPWCITTVGNRVYLGSPLAEHGHNFIYTNLDGEKMWGGKLRGWSGPELLTNDGQYVYALPRGRSAVVRVDLAVQTMKPLVDTKGRRIEAMAAFGGKLYLVLPEPAKPKPPPGGPGSKGPGRAKTARDPLRSELSGKPAASEEPGGLLPGLTKPIKVKPPPPPPPAPKSKSKSKPPPGPKGPPPTMMLEVRDANSGQLLREIHGPDANMSLLVFDPAGKAYSIVGRALCRTEIGGESIRHMVLNDRELVGPLSLAVDPAGGRRIAVGDQDRDAVFVFDTGGKLLVTIGNVGKRKRGPWDPNAVDRPQGLAFDRNGKIWIVENYFTPRRISRFNADGKFEKVFHGPPHYGGGGFLDPSLRSFFYEACEYALDWQAGTSRLVALNDVQRDPLSPDQHPGSYTYTKIGRPIYYKGRRYVVGDVGYQYNPGFTVCLLEGPVWRPCANMGPAAKNVFLLEKPCWKDHWAKQDLTGKSFIWCDRNDDGQYQIDEVELFSDEALGRRGPFSAAYWGNRCGADLTYWGPNARLAPCRFSPGGVPIYERKDMQAFSYAALAPHYGGMKYGTGDISQVTYDGCLVVGGQPYRVGPDLKLRSCAGRPVASDFIPPVLGERYGGLSFVGDVLTKSPLGELGVLNGNNGVWYVVSMTDSLLVGTFFTGRDGTWGGLPKRGMDVTGRKHPGETFFGDFIKAQNGKYYCVVGKGFHAICRVEGLDELRLAEVPVEVTARQVELAKQLRPALIAKAKMASQKGPARPALPCPPLAARTKGFKLDGDLGDWGPAAKMQRIGKPGEKLLFDVAYDDAGLYIAYSGVNVTGNAAQELKFAFTSGFAIDLHVRPDLARRGAGDKRVFFAPFKGRWAAVLFDYHTRGAARGESFTFTSPVARTAVACIAELPGDKARIAFKAAALADEQTNRRPWTAEVFVAWDALGVKPADKTVFGADFGVLGADTGGIATARRAFWMTPDNDDVTDVAVEARFNGETLGNVQIRK